MADDMGFSDIGCYGSEIETPNIDKLAAGGLRFTQFYNGARCCPTRAALLTGLYAHQAGMGGMEPDRKIPGYRGNINKQCVTLAEALKLAGYSTFMTGKWHLTNRRTARTEEDKFYWPCQRGFDRFFGTIAGAGSFFQPATLTRDNENIEQTAREDPDFYYTDAISDHAAGFIREHVAADAARPFFLYVPYTAPHWPLHARDRDIAKYRGRYDRGWDVIRKERHQRMINMGLIDPKWTLPERDKRVLAWDEVDKKKVGGKVEEALDKVNRTLKEEMARKMEVYAAMIDSMDQGIGRIVETLTELGQLDNTLVIFLADNGGCDEWGTYGFGWNRLIANGADAGTRDSSISYGPAWAHVSNTPFRWYKLYTHEGGISTPLIAHWPARIKDHGKLRSQLGHIIDVMPTLLEVAGGEYPRQHAGEKIWPMEGKSLVPALDNKPVERECLFWEHIGNRAVRQGKWKLVARRPTGPWQLYDMEADRTETNDLSQKHPEKVKELAEKWDAWAKRANVMPWPWK